MTQCLLTAALLLHQLAGCCLHHAHLASAAVPEVAGEPVATAVEAVHSGCCGHTAPRGPSAQGELPAEREAAAPVDTPDCEEGLCQFDRFTSPLDADAFFGSLSQTALDLPLVVPLPSWPLAHPAELPQIGSSPQISLHALNQLLLV